MTVGSLRNVAALLLTSTIVSAQEPAAGAREYALGGSSISAPVGTGAVFLNPAGLARLGEHQIIVSTARLRSLASIGASAYVPGVVAIAAASAPDQSGDIITAGAGFRISDHHALGLSYVAPSRIGDEWRLAIGTSLHFPTGGRRTGVDAGLVMRDIPSSIRWAIGAGWWILPSQLRAQYAILTRETGGGRMGLEYALTDRWSVQAGVHGSQGFAFGGTFSTTGATVGLAVGRRGFVVTTGLVLGTSAAERHAQALDGAYDALSSNLLSEAADEFHRAADADEYDDESRAMALVARHRFDSTVTTILTQAKACEDVRDYAGAMRAYAQLLRVDPNRTSIGSDLGDIESRLAAFVGQLIDAGDSLRARKETAQARRSYELALELDPENDVAAARIDELESVSRESVTTQLSRARTLVNRGQLDDAQREYERILAAEPRNSQARAGLAVIAGRRTDQAFESAKQVFDQGKLFEALTMFADIVKQNERHRGAREYLERARQALRGDVEFYFRAGLQAYVKEDYRAAIAAWDNALLIDPEHAGTLEYRKRAEEKLKALEQLR